MCGAGLGFIVANVPGLMVGAYAGNRLGAVRDAKGKSVAAVFSQLGGDQKAQVCTSGAMVKMYSILTRVVLDFAGFGSEGFGIGVVAAWRFLDGSVFRYTAGTSFICRTISRRMPCNIQACDTRRAAFRCRGRRYYSRRVH